MFRTIRRALRAILGHRKIESDLDEELQFHLDMQAQEYERRGMTAQEARFATLRTFGGVQQIKEEVRDLRGVGLIEVFRQDLRFGLRTLRKNPGFTLVAILALALGIGANTAIFSVINGVLLRPLPYERGDRIVLIRQQRTLANMHNVPFSVKEVEDYQSQNHTLSGVVEYHPMWFILLGGEEPERVQTGVVSDNFFDVLGIRPLLGSIAGVIGFSVSQRSHEIGLRMALGARRGAVLWMVLRQGMLLVGAGLSAGILGGLAFSQILQGLLFQVQPNDLLTFIGVSLVLAIIGAAACIFPARRATTVDPTMALRSEP